MRTFVNGLLLALGVLMGGCGDRHNIAHSAKLDGIDLQVEIYPSPPTPGYNEFKVSLKKSGDWRPVDNVIVEMGVRKGPQDPVVAWSMGMQDGLLGIYRRAVEIPSSGHWEAVIRVRKGEMEQQATFPLDVAP
ncbi:MAG: hypothetical protein COX57_13470 [Alphaproteobacteria bacterium CG_4_10_14_0_2_um_filter_63_37]|nr:MAG: hypothetical protein AUJ55_12775 [Proteobacteria bacterium CG1_02_64_396]PJA23491.1 MAG: hypothetical protein COX57_13470 [Alphaproteobacteria bacterium CG_4_10_14_0_2_um_filter_63_37]